MAKSALAGVFTEYELAYALEGAETGVDASGNPVFVTTPGTLVITFTAYQFPQLRYAEGADPKIIRGKGSCMNPSAFPAGLGVGSTFVMSYGGKPGVLTIDAVFDDELGLEPVLGSEFQATWRAT